MTALIRSIRHKRGLAWAIAGCAAMILIAGIVIGRAGHGEEGVLVAIALPFVAVGALKPADADTMQPAHVLLGLRERTR